MNLRRLKKLSKRAAELLPLLGEKTATFPAERDANYHGTFVSDRKVWDRRRCHPDYQPRNEYRTRRAAEIVYTTRAGQRIVIRPPTHPLKGTRMIGSMSGGEQSEWDETDAWNYLDSIVRDHFTNWERVFDEDCPPGGALTRDLSSARLVLAAAREIADIRSRA